MSTNTPRLLGVTVDTTDRSDEVDMMCWLVELIADAPVAPSVEQACGALAVGVRLETGTARFVASYSVGGRTVEEACNAAVARWAEVLTVVDAWEWIVLDLHVHRVDPRHALREHALAPHDG